MRGNASLSWRRQALPLACLLLSWAAAAEEVRIAVVSLADDPRYDSRQLEKRYPGHPEGRPLEGAKVAAAESRFALDAVGATLVLEPVEVRGEAEVAAAVSGLVRRNVRYVVLDLPAPAVALAANTVKPGDALLFNISAAGDSLRGAGCAPNLLHTLPSLRMRTDALMQYLAARKWRKALLLYGPLPADREQQTAFLQSAKRFGIGWAAQRPFKLSNDPRERDLSNVNLLTTGVDYDAVVVADSDGEFARSLPYATQLPRPVAGANGLTAQAWHWAWERNGGPQLNRRFSKAAGRPMTSFDWAAWAAVKAVAASVARLPKAGFARQRDALVSGEVVVDGFKGPRLSFRPWDGQLRQPLFLSHPDGVIATAPVEGFLHPKNNLDTLGADAPDSACRMTR
ncbi:ABC transporter substrate-binding protein [Cupriavidus basilensis]|uniref:ABC transporter substrate-binding protein n=1 Tax=Cupriavidus basilensis TaxID=68895 RepID=UPI00283B9BA0|nr:ABC transporter substrate-binding protein [Cupriavidus basilensis]MDR3384384.1 ABC transporter substrate-binding protein [Cupriavidus basilensis]